MDIHYTIDSEGNEKQVTKEEIKTMTYRNEMHEVITTVPTYVEHRTITENLPEGFMIEQDGQKFYPRYYKSENTERCRPGYFYFYQDRKTVKFVSFEEAQTFILGFVGMLQWMGGIAASTPVEEETYEDMLAAQYNERLLGQVVYYTENVDHSERVGRLLKASRDGVLLADPAESSDMGCWYSFTQVSNIQRGRQYGWK